MMQNMNDQRSPQHSEQRPGQRMTSARVAKMNPKVVMWMAFCVGMIALLSFSTLFIHAAYRNTWW